MLSRRSAIPRPPWQQHQDTAPPPQPGGAPPDSREDMGGNRQLAQLLASVAKLPEHDQRLAAIVGYLSQIENGRQALVDALWARTPVLVDERHSDMTGAVTSIVTTPATRNMVKITSLIAILPTGVNAGGTLQLGERFYPLPGGITQWGGIAILLQSGDVRKLTSSQLAGNMTLELMGEIVPTFGRIS